MNPSNHNASDVFKNQIEHSLEDRFLELKKLHADKHLELDNLKKSILQEAFSGEWMENPKTPLVRENGIEDNQMTSSEWETLFFRIQGKHTQVLDELGVKGSEAFLGILRIYEGVEYRPELESISLFGKKWDHPKCKIKIPLSITKEGVLNLSKICRQIETYFEGKEKLIDQITSYGPNRLKCHLKVSEKISHYVASSYGVLKIIEKEKGPDPEKLAEHKKVFLELVGKSQEKDFEESVVFEEMLTFIAKGIPLKPADKKKVPSKYLPLIQEYERFLNAPENRYRSLLLEEKKNQEIREERLLFMLDSYYHFSVTPEGNSCRLFYDGNEELSQVEFWSDDSDENGSDSLVKKEIEFLAEKGQIESNFDLKGNLVKVTRFDAEGNTKSIRRGEEEVWFSYEANNIIAKTDYSNPNKLTRLVDEAGNLLNTFDVAKGLNKTLTIDAYLDLLADKLDTYEKLHLFFKLYMCYRDDSLQEREHWQLAAQTIQRVEGGKMIGDCDDFAFLAREILNRQNPSKNAEVLIIPSHAVCVWFEQNGDKYHAYSIGTFGFDQDGHRTTNPDVLNRSTGFDSLEEAINAITKKFQNTGIGVKNPIDYQVENSCLQIGESRNGHPNYIKIPLAYFEHPVLRKDYIEKLNPKNQMEARESISYFNAQIQESPKDSLVFHSCIQKIINGDLLSDSKQIFSRDERRSIFKAQLKRYPQVYMYQQELNFFDLFDKMKI